MATFFGMRSSTDWTEESKLKDWREAVLFYYPNGQAPLTALMAKLKKEPLMSTDFKWADQGMPTQGGSITGVYTDYAMSNAVVHTLRPSAGSAVFVKCPQATAEHMRAGHQVTIQSADADELSVMSQGKVIGVILNGADSQVQVVLLDGDNSTGTLDLNDADEMYIIGNINEEGAAMPDSISYNESWYDNHTQIFRTPMEITRTAAQIKYRTGDKKKELKRQILELHSVEQEKAYLFSYKSLKVGKEGKPERTTMGLLPVIKQYAAANCGDFRVDHSGSTWLSKGEDWLNAKLEKMFEYGSSERLVFCGNGVLTALNALVTQSSGTNYDWDNTTTAYGIAMKTFFSTHGTLHFLSHPLFNTISRLKHSAMCFEPTNLKYRYIQDTKFFKADELGGTGYARRDGTKDEFLTEAGLEWNMPYGWSMLENFGRGA